MAENLENTAYEKIKVAISKGYIKKGSQLREVPLTKNLNMSRATVKGALKRLVYEGLAEHKQNRGIFVINPSVEDIQETFQVRIQLEKMAASLAVSRLHSKDFEKLHQLIQEEKNVFKARELDRYYEINNAIHLQIANSSGNKLLCHYIEDVLQKSTIYLILFDPFYQMLDRSNSSPFEHETIVRCLEKKDERQAGIEIKKHLESSIKGIDVERLFPEDYLTV